VLDYRREKASDFWVVIRIFLLEYGNGAAHENPHIIIFLTSYRLEKPGVTRTEESLVLSSATNTQGMPLGNFSRKTVLTWR